MLEIKRYWSSTRFLVAVGALALAALACEVQLTDATPTAPAVGTACDDAAFVMDVTVPDGTRVGAGEQFTKTWRLANTGTCTWSAGYRLAFVQGDAMGGTSTLLGKSVSPGGQADISVVLTAPSTNGTFRGNWRMHNGSNVAFGSTVFVAIGVTNAPGPSPTGAPTSSTTYKISGSAGVGSGVTVTCIGKNLNKPTVQATVDNNGNYFCNVPLHWAGSIEPFKQGWTFSPQRIEGIDDVTADLPNQNFTATQ